MQCIRKTWLSKPFYITTYSICSKADAYDFRSSNYCSWNMNSLRKIFKLPEENKMTPKRRN